MLQVRAVPGCDISPIPAQIWVNSPHTASGYYTIYDNETLQADHFNTRLSFGDAAQTLWARTGYLGFVRRTELTAASGGGAGHGAGRGWA